MMIAATKVPSPTKEEACTDRKLRVETGPRSACRFQVRGAGGGREGRGGGHERRGVRGAHHVSDGCCHKPKESQTVLQRRAIL